MTKAMTPDNEFMDLFRNTSFDQLMRLDDKVRFPHCRIVESEKTIELHIELPGADKKDIEVHVEPTYVEVKTEKKEESKVETKKEYMHELTQSQYYRRIPLPSQVQEEKAKAKYENGMLLVSIPKKSPLPGKRKLLIE